MDSEAPGLGVEFIIEPVYDGLVEAQRVMDSAEFKVVASAKKIEQATSGMLNLGASTASVQTFGSAATRELQNVARETARAEKSGEGMVRQLERQVETFGKTTSEIRNMRAEQRALAAEGQGLTELADRIRGLNANLNRLEGGTGGATKGAAQMRAAMQGASFQVQDLITQVSMGANPINALAVQGGQLAGQFSNVENKAGAVARFMVGPWGLAITAGLMVLGPLVSKLLEQNDALDKAVDKLRANARESEITRAAQERFVTSAEGVRAAILDQKHAFDEADKAMGSAAERANALARQNYEYEVSIRRVTMALLERAQAEQAAANSTGFGAAGGAGAGMAQSFYAKQVSDLRARLAEQTSLIETAERNLNRSRVGLAVEYGKQMSTSAGRITKQYDMQILSLQRTANAQAAAGKTIDASLTRQIRMLEERKQAALDADKAQDRLNKTSVANQVGRNIGLGDARDIVQGLGGRVTSEQRSRAEQERLYAKYVAYKQGVGPWAALAAKPGTSNHELGQAIDIAKSDGITLKKLITAFRAKGVSLTEALDEGSHFHIAWKKVGEQARQASAEQSAADREIKQAAAEAKQHLEQSQGFLSGLTEETNRIGKTAEEIKMIEVVAQAAKAPTDALRESILNAGNAWETADWMNKQGSLFDTIKPVNIEDALIWGDPLGDQLQEVIDHLTAIADQAGLAGEALANAFGAPGEAIGSLIANVAEYRLQRQEMADKVAATTMKQADMDQALAVLQARNTAQAISGAKSLFKEKSAGYKAMQAVEMAYAAWQAIDTVRSIAMDTAKTTSSVANSGARAAADGVAAVAKAIASLPFPLNLAAGAATAAALVAFGVKMFGGGGGGRSAVPPTSAEDLQAAAGTGTVLGDSKAKSESIARSLEIVAANTNSDLQYSNDMLKALRSIDNSIGQMAGAVARQIAVSGGMFDTSGLGLGSSGSKGFLGLFGSSTTRSL